MQYRSLTFWLVALVLFAFLIGDVLSIFHSYAMQATSPEPIIIPIPGGESLDRAALARQALEVASFSTYTAWKFIDRVGLSSTLFIGFIVAFIWQRDRRWDMVDLINAQPITSWQYVIGKYLGAVLTWGSLLAGLILVGAGRAYQVAVQFGLPFAISDFLLPVLPSVGISLLYGTALLLALSLLLQNSVGTLLIYFFYWVYAVTQFSMFQDAGSTQFLTFWFFRADLLFAPESYSLLQSHQGEMWINRLLYLVLTAALLGLCVLVYRHRRGYGMFVRITPLPEQQSLPAWKRWLQRLNSL